MQHKNNHNKNLQNHDNLNNYFALQHYYHNEGDKRTLFNNNNHEKDKILYLSKKNGFKKLLINLKKIYINNFERNPGIVYFVIPSMIQFSENEIKVHTFTSNIFLK